MKTEDKRITRSKKALKMAFINLLKTNSFKDISINDISLEAGYAKSTFYRQYRDKYEFVDSIMEDEIASMKNIMDEFISSHNSKEQWTREIIQEYREFRFNYVYREKDLYKALFTYDCFKAFPHMLSNMIYNHQIKQFPLPNAPTIGNKDFMEFIFSYIFVDIISYWIKTDFQYSSHIIAELFLNISLVGDDNE